MEGCGPCNATRPEWAKLTRVLHRDFANRGDISIVDIDTDLADNLAFLLSKPDSFPTIRFISRYGKEVEQYEDSPIETKDRSIDSFIKWIKLKTGEKNITIGELTKTRNMRMRRMTHKNTRKNYRMRKQRRTRRFGLRGSRIQ